MLDVSESGNLDLYIVSSDENKTSCNKESDDSCESEDIGDGNYRESEDVLTRMMKVLRIESSARINPLVHRAIALVKMRMTTIPTLFLPRMTRTPITRMLNLLMEFNYHTRWFRKE